MSESAGAVEFEEDGGDDVGGLVPFESSVSVVRGSVPLFDAFFSTGEP